MATYADILTTDLESVRSVILEQNIVRCNVIETRCVVKWAGDMPQELVDLGCTPRSHSEALSYYSNLANGWELERPF